MLLILCKEADTDSPCFHHYTGITSGRENQIILFLMVLVRETGTESTLANDTSEREGKTEENIFLNIFLCPEITYTPSTLCPKIVIRICKPIYQARESSLVPLRLPTVYFLQKT